MRTRDTTESASPLTVPIIQFGTSRFLQAHVDLFVDEARRSGQDIGPITVVQTSASTANAERVAAFGAPGGYPVVIRGLRDGAIVDATQTVQSIERGLIAARDWPAVSAFFVNEAQIVVSNVGETGYEIPLSDRGPLLWSGAVPVSFIGKLTALLMLRFNANRRPMLVLPCELFNRNGQVLKAAVISLANDAGAPAEFIHWIDTAVTFVDTLVDRIVSQALEPIGAVAEPYALWAIQNQPGLKFPFTHANVQLVQSLEPFERLKLHILNLGHTFLAGIWRDEQRPPRETVREILADSIIKSRLQHLYQTEVLPGFAAHAMQDEAAAYVARTLERFANPFLDHRMSDIAQNHSAKIERRIKAFIAWCATGTPPFSHFPVLQSIVAREAQLEQS